MSLFVVACGSHEAIVTPPPRPNVLSIVATRDGDRLTGEWREGRDRHAFTTRKPTPFAARGEAHALSGWLGTTRIRARLQVKLFDLVKDHVALDRFASTASKAVTAASTTCMEEDHVTVEDEGLPQTTIPKSELARIFDVRSPIGKELFQ